jgi:methylenetetrahydrofolate reductase (NADPH)
MKAGTNLKKVLDSGAFTVTAEVGPPKGGVATVVRKKAKLLRNYCDALNVTDNQAAIVRLSSMAGCVLVKETGTDPVMQIVCRDRNRIAIQSDILGAVALGIGNILCLSGDHQRFGNHPSAKGVFDIDSIQLVQTIKHMRDKGKFISGDDVMGNIPIFIGAAANPFADPTGFRLARLAKKVQAGADFIQTQAIFDVTRFADWMKQVCDYGLDKKVHIIAGVVPPKSVGMARYMKDYVPGIYVPDEVIARLEDAKNIREESVKMTLGIIDRLKDIEGVHGVHIMAVGWEDVVPEIVQKAGLLPRPRPLSDMNQGGRSGKKNTSH